MIMHVREAHCATAPIAQGEPKKNGPVRVVELGRHARRWDVEDSWLGFLDTFRTLYVAPNPEIRKTFEAIRREVPVAG